MRQSSLSRAEGVILAAKRIGSQALLVHARGGFLDDAEIGELVDREAAFDIAHLRLQVEAPLQGSQIRQEGAIAVEILGSEEPVLIKTGRLFGEFRRDLDDLAM